MEYRSFGTKLDIVPIIHGQGELTMEVRAEVSDVASDLAGGNTPGFRVRRVDTGVRMKMGHTLALAGDYREETETIVRGIPGLMDAPWVGALFRDSQEQTIETELVFLITPQFIDEVDLINTPMPGRVTQSAPGHDLFKYGTVEVEAPCITCDPGPAAPGRAGFYATDGAFQSNQAYAPAAHWIPDNYSGLPTDMHVPYYAPAPPVRVMQQAVPSSTNPMYPPSPRENLTPPQQINASGAPLTNAPPSNEPPVTNVAPTGKPTTPLATTSNPSATTIPPRSRPDGPPPSTVNPPVDSSTRSAIPEKVEPQSSEAVKAPKKTLDDKFKLPNPFENRRNHEGHQRVPTVEAQIAGQCA